MTRPLTDFESRVLVAVGVTQYNKPAEIGARMGRTGNSAAIVVNQALQRMEARGLVTYGSEANAGGTNRTNAGKHGWELTTAGANECQIIARMGGASVRVRQ